MYCLSVIVIMTCCCTSVGFPKVADIFLDPSHAEYGKPLCLSCEVMDFDPGVINIQWLDGENVIRNGVDTKGPTKGSNGLFSLTSSYRLVPTFLDYNKFISFKVSHEKPAEPITKNVYLTLPGMCACKILCSPFDIDKGWY